jgi:23S rRNA (adenine2503-C2)-methyltransferase
VEQVVAARRAAGPSRLSNVVFMGMGEPLANYGRLLPALRRINADLGIAARHLTVSTVGIVPGILKLSSENLQVNLAVSLHAGNDELRDRIVPINRRYPLAVLMGACADYVAATRRRISFEWALIEDVNDHLRDAAELAGLARPLGAHVNLIPLNATPGFPTRGTSRRGVEAFGRQLSDLGINVTVRRNRGTDIAAACGQLAAAPTAESGPDAGDTAALVGDTGDLANSADPARDTADPAGDEGEGGDRSGRLARASD